MKGPCEKQQEWLVMDAVREMGIVPSPKHEQSLS